MRVQTRNNLVVITSAGNPILVLQKEDAKELQRRLNDIMRANGVVHNLDLAKMVAADPDVSFTFNLKDQPATPIFI